MLCVCVPVCVLGASIQITFLYQSSANFAHSPIFPQTNPRYAVSFQRDEFPSKICSYSVNVSAVLTLNYLAVPHSAVRVHSEWCKGSNCGIIVH